MVNPMQMIQMLRGGGDIKTLMENTVGNTPQFQRVMQMVNGKSPLEMQQIAMNLCQQQGIDFSKALQQMSSMGLNVPKDLNPNLNGHK